MRLTHDDEAAKDLFQETMCRALANKEKYNPGTNVNAWLFTIMRNIFINNYRRQAKQRIVFENRGSDSVIDSGKFTVNNDGEQAICLKELEAAIHRLPLIFKTPFLLYFEGYRYSEISRSLNEPLGTIKSRIHFARKLLKEQITRC